MTTHLGQLAVLAVFGLLAGCASGPRTSTSDERATAFATLTTIETCLAILVATEKIPEPDYAAAMAQVSELRAMVANSETVEMAWPDLMQRIANLSIRWLVPRE